ncbi:MAG: hypothetical protein MI924_20285 [Chloroflexales bacterium]|nr:hypothetical protein [Chloroflexales bacterium]
MADYSELLRLLSIPRPNGSVAERATARVLHDWLTARGSTVRCSHFGSIHTSTKRWVSG